MIEFGPQIKVNCLNINLTNLEKHILLLFTGAQRKSSDIASTYKFNKNNHKKLIRLTEKATKAIEYNDMPLLGKIIDESWALKRQLSDKVSNDTIDDFYRIGMKCGSYGGKISGAGGGGMLMLIAPPDKHKIIIKKTGLLHIPFSFTNGGSQIIYGR